MGLACFTGSAYMMLPALILGGAGCVDSSPQMAPDVWVEIYDAFQDGDMARAEKAQARGAEITDFMIEFGNPSTPKAVLGERLGVDCGDPRPATPADDPRAAGRVPPKGGGDGPDEGASSGLRGGGDQ